ncbi:TolC family protein [Suttonella sp. R2A3]|uniref:TolC family protein n=1 Tax=Suttonella sp. R2A3 TaxID=2908648 RepID=UPI001F4432F0|nr:TolC family protein [Suttonella sp. R2A3]UJF24078.1 TolC family protein [Suttonella sp. R2A3]
MLFIRIMSFRTLVFFSTLLPLAALADWGSLDYAPPAGETAEAFVSSAAPVSRSTLAPTPRLTTLTFADALAQTTQQSPSLQAAQADVAAKTLQSEALDGINKPWVFVSATAARYRVNADLDTSDVQNRINALGGQVDQFLGQLPPIPGLSLPDFSQAGNLLPNPIDLQREDTYTNAALSAVWPVYSGGRLEAMQDLVGARAEEAQSNLASVEQGLQRTLIERYFGLQLAKMALRVREQAKRTIAGHDHMAQRFYDQGMIARKERLEAQAALSDAQMEVEQARNRVALTEAGLAALVNQPDIQPANAIFVDRTPLPPLQFFQDQAISHFPGFAKIDAKEHQVSAMKDFSEGAFKPSISVLGRHDIRAHDADWMVGVNMRYTLWSGIDRQKMIEAADIQQQQISAVRAQAQSDIRLLVKKHYLAVEDALARFAAHSAQLPLAREQARLASRGFAEGLATAQDAIDSETNLAKVRTERAQSAYDYLLALADLLDSAGIPETFIDYQLRADVRIDEALYD